VRAVEDYNRSLGDHGQPMSEATDPDATWDYVAGATVVDPEGRTLSGVPVIDRAKKAQQDAEERYREANKDKTGFNMHGMFFPVSRVDRTPPAQR
jgi:hypothetical protein